jgi:hypothetical protein
MTRAPIVFGTARVDLRHRMRLEYETGLTIHQVAAQFGRSYGTTHKLLTEAGTQMRGRGGANGH